MVKLGEALHGRQLEITQADMDAACRHYGSPLENAINRTFGDSRQARISHERSETKIVTHVVDEEGGVYADFRYTGRVAGRERFDLHRWLILFSRGYQLQPITVELE